MADVAPREVDVAAAMSRLHMRVNALYAGELPSASEMAGDLDRVAQALADRAGACECYCAENGRHPGCECACHHDLRAQLTTAQATIARLEEECLHLAHSRLESSHALEQAEARERALREALDQALRRATEHYEGCLYCGDGEIVDGETTAAHQAECWWYRAKLLARHGRRARGRDEQAD